LLANTEAGDVFIELMEGFDAQVALLIRLLQRFPDTIGRLQGL
jgi:hypothetical protein